MISETIHENADLSLVVGKMKDFIRKAHRDVECRATAIAIVKDKCRGREVDCMATTIYDWIINHVKYYYDPHDVEYVQDWINIIRSQSGDCDDFTILGCSLLGSMGIKTRMILGKTKRATGFDHVYLEYYSPVSKQWIPFDASQTKSVGWESENIVTKKIIEV